MKEKVYINTKICNLTLVISKIESLVLYHKCNSFYCETRTIWQEKCYRKNLIYYSPRIRKLALNNENFEITKFDDVYFLMMEIYVEITGVKIPPHYMLDGRWISILRKAMNKCDEDVVEAIVALLLKFASAKAVKYEDVEDIQRSEEYLYLLNKLQLEG